MSDPLKKNELAAKIIAHAWKDPQFKKRLLSDPQKALEELDCHCPRDCKVKVIEEQENTWTIVIPQAPVNIKRLTEEQVQTISAGEGSGPVHTSPGNDTACITNNVPACCASDAKRRR